MDNEVIRNRRINPRRKVDPAVLENSDEHIAALRSAVAEAEIITNSLRGNEGWEALCRNWEGQLQEIEDKLDDFLQIPDKIRDFLLKERQDIKTLLGTLESIDAKATRYRNDLSIAIEKQNARKERVGTTQE